MDQTRKQIRQRVASILDDIVEVEATANGTTLTLIDTFNVNAGAESFDGCEIFFTSGANDGETRRVTTTTPSTGTLTFTPEATATVAADTAELYNRRNKGFRVQDYHRAINHAIEEYQGIALIPVIEEIGIAFDAETQTIAVPATTLEVHTVEYQDSNDQWCEVRQAYPRGGQGWTAEPADAVIRIEGDPAWEADTYDIRLHGYKRADALTTDASVLPFDSTVIVNTAAYRLALSGVSRDSKYGAMVITLKQDMIVAQSRIRDVRKNGTQRVRL